MRLDPLTCERSIIEVTDASVCWQNSRRKDGCVVVVFGTRCLELRVHGEHHDVDREQVHRMYIL